MGILASSSSTQNDYVVAYWLLCFTTLLVARPAATRRWSKSALVGAALGLAVLTKATASFYAPPLALLYLLHRPRRRAELARQLLVIGCIAGMIVGPFALRNLDAFRSPLGPFQLPGGQPRAITITTDLRPSSPSARWRFQRGDVTPPGWPRT